jgi:hypothetical protein
MSQHEGGNEGERRLNSLQEGVDAKSEEGVDVKEEDHRKLSGELVCCKCMHWHASLHSNAVTKACITHSTPYFRLKFRVLLLSL